jgi:hypothetical protein
LWNTAAAGVVGVLVVTYIAAATVEVVMSRQGVADVAALASASGSSSVLQTLEATMQSVVATMQAADLFYQVSFWAMFIAFFGWLAIQRARLRALGRVVNRRRTIAWRVWQVGLLISIVTVCLGAGDSGSKSLEALASEFNRLTVFYTVRVAVGAAYLWVVYTAWRSAGPELAGGHLTPTGNPIAAQGYEPASLGSHLPPVPGAPAQQSEVSSAPEASNVDRGDVVMEPATRSRSGKVRPFHVKLLVVGVVVALLAGLYGFGRWVKSNSGPSALSVLANRAGCTDFQADGPGYASSDEGHCVVDHVDVQLATFPSNSDRDRWVHARRTFGSLAVGGSTTTCVAEGDLWVIEASSGPVCSQVAASLGGELILP